jgi:hypothetical protein
MYNDPNQPPYGQEPQQPDELPPPTQYAPQAPYGQEPPPPPSEQPPYGQQPDELPPTQYAPQLPAYQAQQPPYGQAPQPPLYGQQPAYGAPVPNVPPAYATPPQQKKSLKWLWITLSIVAGVLILSCGACVSLGLYGSISGPRSAAQSYFKAVEGQDYASAFNYFAPGAYLVDPQNGQHITIPSKAAYTNASRLWDQNYGNLTDYQLNSGSGSNQLVATLTRSKQSQTYTIDLQMTQIDNKWKILSVDGF